MSKDIIVLGSAPGASIPKDHSNYFIVAANGAISPFPLLVPDVLILNGWTLSATRGIGIKSRDNLRGRKVRKLIVIDNTPDARKLATESGIDYESIEFWSKEERKNVCVKQSKIDYPGGNSGNGIPSTGVTAICYALNFNSAVYISGIDTKIDGHSYSEDNFKRGHILEDERTMNALASRIKNLPDSTMRWPGDFPGKHDKQ